MINNKKRFFFITLGIVTVIGALFINASETEGGYDIGDLATDFSLPDVNGNLVSMADYPDAKGFIIVFTCNTCPYAKAYEQRIIGLADKYNDKGFPLIAINPNDVSQSPGDSMEEMKNRANSKNYSFPYLQDEEQTISRKYGPTKTPHVFVLSKKSSDLRIEYIGAIDNSPRNANDANQKYVENAVDEILSGSSPTVTSKRAIGCGIKWKGV